jgi:putative NIF3 family GTP cyclohydrolase 1 type 2
MTTTSDIIRFMEETKGGDLNRDEGVQHGDAERTVVGVTVSWMGSSEAIDATGKRGDDLFIGHESLYYPYDYAVRKEMPDGWQDWTPNRRRRDLLDRHNLVFLRAHGTVDTICIFDDFAALFDLGEPVAAEGNVKVFEIEPLPLRELVKLVCERVGMPAVRLSPAGDMDRLVHRVGLPWGGLGQFVNVSYQQRLIDQGCDVFIAGESDSYGFRYAAEAGIPMIETTHEDSENPGMCRFAGMLSDAFPELRVTFHDCPSIWQWAGE